ncbi:VWA domain-containing protein [Phytoactinopolyspora alkaliphila]|uniref:VWA domain-containing protein n=1 Tax=Phytoactinopolyspora alkaliphila TaxID=1783498 RepID=A0A6N9YT73_9ACTN|nr:VWA domain-containing protein [Phytoactinopolyspora alkaliphila]NED98241.1 VWA domain-containing protein [Phytoactinopolyspora alkaliphila]
MTGTGRYLYGRWHEGPDPLAPPVDLREALDSLGRDVMQGYSPRSALDEMLRRGTRTATGLDDLTRRVWQRRAEIQARNRLDGTLREVRRLLDEAIDAERRALFPDPSDEARLSEAELDALPAGTAAAVRELAPYRWRSEQAREKYRRIEELLGRELLDAQFARMRDALSQADQVDADRAREMLADLNALLSAHAQAAGDINARFDEFMSRHGAYFPENPNDVDELIDALAARAAAAQRMLNSMTPEQRAELAELSQRAFGDPRLAGELAALNEALRALRPQEDWSSSTRFSGQQQLGLGAGAQAMADLAELDALAEQLSQSYPGARLEDIDVEALERQLGSEATVDARRLAELERQLREHGLLERAADGSLRLSPKALRRLAEAALADVIRAVRETGQRDTESAGSAGDLSGATTPWEFGDSRPWDASRTVRNAVLRVAASGAAAGRGTTDGPAGRGPHPAGDGRIRLDVTDVEVAETEHRSRAAVALCVDTSWSMVQEGRWLPMKRMALALHHLLSTRFRQDALQLITFGRHAASVELEELVGLDGVWEQGTNAHHALLLAGRHLRRHPGAKPVVLMVTDGEPTAHLEPDGTAEFSYPPSMRTLRKTVAEVDRLAGLGASVTVFRLGDDPALAEFVDLIARRSGGRVIAPVMDGLGAAVVGDYLRTRNR